MSSPCVTFQEADGIGRLTLQRPPANAMSPDAIGQLLQAVTDASQSAARVLLVTGAGANFCVGADVRHLGSGTHDMPAELDAMAIEFHEAIARIAELTIPVVAAVQGNAVGAGFGLMLVADIVVASKNARMSTGYTRLRLSADAGVSYFLTQQLGVRQARALLITARFLSAPEALALGVVDEIVPDAELFARAEALAVTLSNGPTDAYRAIKRLTGMASENSGLRSQLDSERSAIVALARNPDVRAALNAVLR